MFACLSALDEAGLSAIAERMFALVRDPLQKVPHRLAGVRVIINVEKTPVRPVQTASRNFAR